MIGAMPAALTGGHGALATCVTSSTGRLVCTSTTGLGAAFFVFLILEIAILVVSIVAAVQIVTKAGYSGWWVLTAIVPILNIVMFLVFAFSDWPVRRELAGLRSPWGSPGGGAYGSPPGSWGGPGPWGGGAAAPWSTSDPLRPDRRRARRDLRGPAGDVRTDRLGAGRGEPRAVRPGVELPGRGGSFPVGRGGPVVVSGPGWGAVPHVVDPTGATRLGPGRLVPDPRRPPPLLGRRGVDRPLRVTGGPGWARGGRRARRSRRTACPGRQRRARPSGC